MNHTQAKTIAADYAPSLVVDPLNPQHPDMFVVRKTPTGTPFSIHLTSIDPATVEPVEAKDAQPEQPSMPGIEGNPGQPYVPARPAIPGRTAAEIISERETKLLTDALDSAKAMLGVK